MAELLQVRSVFNRRDEVGGRYETPLGYRIRRHDFGASLVPCAAARSARQPGTESEKARWRRQCASAVTAAASWFLHAAAPSGRFALYLARARFRSLPRPCVHVAPGLQLSALVTWRFLAVLALYGAILVQRLADAGHRSATAGPAMGALR